MAHHSAITFDHYCALLAQTGAPSLKGILRGLEKESLRITPEARLAQTDHSTGLGSALTHPHITTDYSEALLEFITQPLPGIAELLQQLDDIHRFTYQQIAQDNELLWPASMPCVLGPDAEIPVARYGSSNSGTMKTIYRVGLGHRYGRAMQTIAGVHYNFSFPDELWEWLRAQEKSSESLQDFKTRRYFALIRNFRRYFWLLIYLFGAAPAVCGSFVNNREHRLQPFNNDARTMHLPYATSLRMGDLGYQSAAQQSLFVCYNNLPSYLQTLCGAITRTHPEYAAIGLQDAAGNYLQLNTNLLQIENEFYSSIRPKRTSQSGETALQALRLRGVEYVEVRCVDLNPYEPLGVSAEQLRVMDAFLLFCLLADSPATSPTDYLRDQENQARIVYAGRDPQLQLLRGEQVLPMQVWAAELLEQISACAALFDASSGGDTYAQALALQKEKLANPELTPSARVLRDLQEQGLSFAEHSLGLAEQHRAYFAARRPDAPLQAHFTELAMASCARQREIEQQVQPSFEAYLANYYAQYQDCNCMGGEELAPTAELAAARPFIAE